MKLMVLDGNSIINRAFYGIRQLTTRDGTPTNAIYGFLTILQKLEAEESPDALCVTFDLPAPTFRHERYSGYKAQRKGMPDELAVQMPVMKEVLDAMNIQRHELAGWEADDIIGAIAAKCEDEDCECVIVTGDKDSLQLVTEKTRVKHVKTRMGQTETKDYTVSAFVEEYGFEPINMVDLKALMGDASDNIPGVAGVGEKTALDLIRRFTSIEKIYAELDALDIRDTLRKKLLNGRNEAFMSYELAEIRRDVPIDFSPEDCLRKGFDNDRLYELFGRLEFNKLMAKFGLEPPDNNKGRVSQDEIEVTDIISKQDAEKMMAAAARAEIAYLSLDTSLQAAAVSLPSRETYLLRRGITEDFDSVLRGILSGRVNKAGHYIKDILRSCLELGIETSGWSFDTALAAYLISPTDNSYDIGRISERYCGYRPSSAFEENGQMTLLHGVDAGNALAGESYAIGLLHSELGAILKERGLEELFCQIEMPLCAVLAEMESTGFLIDKSALTAFGEMLAVKITDVEKQIFIHADETFNINSPKQLGVILFEKLMLPAPKKTKTGYSTNSDVLDSLEGKHPIISLIKDYRELTKLKSTYADGLLKVICGDGRIHTRFQMTVTATGRLSSVEPNLQNIPVRKEMGGELRKMFVAGEGNVLVDADYSQIELRLLAHIADDNTMREAFMSGEDIHAVTASQVFGVPLSEVTPVMRARAKAVNFGIVYGISAFSLSHDIAVTAREAKMYIDNYFEKYSGVRDYMTEIIKKAKLDGYVSTLFGRRRYLPEIASSNHNTRSFGERVALNMPIQGTAADIMKIAMIRVSRRLKEEGLSARLVLQVHDELIAECPEGEAEKVRCILCEEMERSAALTVPLIAEAGSGRSWYEAK